MECPTCKSEAYYKYGKTSTGKQRFRCVLCGRQYTDLSSRKEVTNRPVCSTCGSPMHLYKREPGIIRFRCSNYPRCKKFLKTLENDL